MKTNEEAIGLAIGKVDAHTKEVCRALAEKGISTLVMHKEDTHNVPNKTATDIDNHHWSGKPGEDLFFNGWKLLF